MLELSKPSSGGRSVEIRQIYYSDETRLQLDPGFIPLDNCGERPDWREYWPIRKFLLGHALDENTLYGFFSPKFGQKTTLRSSAVNAFIASVQSDADVISFSPFFDQSAVYLNTFEQAATNQPGIWPVFEQSVALIAPGIDPHAAPMDSRHSIFCNYFVATPAFWRRWLEMCETLFAIAETGNSALGSQLNAPAVYGSGFVPSKVFIIERVVSLLLAAERHWRVKQYDPIQLPMSGSMVSPYPVDLSVLDALKTAAIETGRASYLQIFLQIRETLIQTARRARNAAAPQTPRT